MPDTCLAASLMAARESPSSPPRSADRASVRTTRPTAPTPCTRSIPEALRNKPPQPRRSRPGERRDRRTGSSETVPLEAAVRRASLRRTSPPPAAWSCRGCACRPSVLPSDPDRLAPLPGSRNACLSAESLCGVVLPIFASGSAPSRQPQNPYRSESPTSVLLPASPL